MLRRLALSNTSFYCDSSGDETAEPLSVGDVHAILAPLAEHLTELTLGSHSEASAGVRALLAAAMPNLTVRFDYKPPGRAV